MLLSTYHKPLLLLITVPALISLGIGLMPLATLPLEEILQGSSYSQFISIQTTDQARSLLSVIATGAITTLSLTYSIVLLVFTLAAGNIGPRLLRRFSSDLVNQITAGLLAAPFSIPSLRSTALTQTSFPMAPSPARLSSQRCRSFN